MRKIPARFAVGLLLFVVAAPATLAAEPLPVRVLSYNIHHGEGVDGRLDLERIAGLIRSVEPDLVALQEVDRKTKRTGRIDQPAELARLTGMKILFERNIRFQGGEYGNAILARWPVTEHENHHLPSFDDGEQRGVLVAEVQPDDFEEHLLFLATHLDHRSDDRERFASARAINALIRKRHRVPAILAGDLNDTPDSRVLKRFAQEWSRTNEQALPTVPVGRPTRQIDFILVRPAARWNVREVRVLDEKVASDHRPILAILEWLPARDGSPDSSR